MTGIIKKHPILTIFISILVIAVLYLVIGYSIISIKGPLETFIFEKKLEKLRIGDSQDKVIELVGRPKYNFISNKNGIEKWTYFRGGVLVPDWMYKIEFEKNKIKNIKKAKGWD